MSRSGCGLKRVVRCTGTERDAGSFSWALVCVRGVQLTLCIRVHVSVSAGEFSVSSSDQRQCVPTESLSYAPMSGDSSRGYCLLGGSFRPAKNNRIRTGTDQGNPTV